MKHTEFLLVTGDTLEHALKLMKEQINQQYGNQGCKINQMFLLPEGKATSALATQPNGAPTIKYVVNLVAVIDEEPEIDNLQRNYKPVFDFINNNRQQFVAILLGWLATVSGVVPPDKQAEFFQDLNKATFNE